MIGNPPPLRPRELGGNKRRKIKTTVLSPRQRRGEPLAPTRYGTDLRSRRPEFIRILTQNIDGIGFGATSDKIRRLHDTCVKYGIDIFTLSETNINWDKVQPHQTLRGRTKGWKEDCRIAVANNTTDPRTPRHQYGGTGIVALDKMAHTFYKRDKDFRDLGRWISMTFRGKGGLLTRVVSCYCPVKPTEFHEGSVYHQHVKALQLAGIHRCPREQFWIDLNLSIDKWQQDKEHIIVAGDFNHHIRVCNEKLAGKGLTEFITATHGLSDAPATHQSGSVPIDGIFVSDILMSHMRGGYLQFDQATRSDHRGLWIELPIQALIGYNMNDLIIPAARRLKMEDPRVVKKYVDYLDAQFNYHKLYHKLAHFANNVVYPLTTKQENEYESIDKIRIQCMVAAEKRCRKLRKGAKPYSAAYKKARDEVDFWTGMKRKRTGLHHDTARLLRLMRRLHIEDVYYPIEIVLSELNNAWKRYKDVCNSGPEFRQEFIDGLTEAQAEAQNIPKVKALRNLQHREMQRDNARTIQYVLFKLHGGGTSVVIVNKSGRSVELTSMKAIEAALLQEHLRKYHQIEDFCPLLDGQLLHDIGILGDGPQVPNILSGSYIVPPGTPPGTRLYLDQIRRTVHSPTVQMPEYTLDDYKESWKKVKERTSSHGPAHFGHYKAGCTNDAIAKLHYIMAEIPFISGYSPLRHRRGTDLVLVKKANDFRIEKLRTIVLFDAECNMNNGRIGRAALRKVINSNQFAPEQYSRPNRRAIDHALNRRLMFDHFAFKRRPFSMTSCDLAGCYDRVAHNAVSLALQRAGIPAAIINGMHSTLQHMIHVVRTAFGDSTSSYGGEENGDFRLPCMGFFQGNKAGPPIWSIISSTIFDILRKQGYGVRFCSALSHTTFILCGFAYVDDSDLIADGDTYDLCHKKMQATISLWEGLIKATGGVMAPNKSWWYLVDFAWTNGRWKFKSAGNDLQMFAHDSEGNKKALQYLHPGEATKMLGVFMAPNGNNARQVQYMRSKTTAWANNIQRGTLTQAQAYVATVTTIFKTVEYPLAALDLKLQEVKSAIWPIHKVALKKMGIHPCVSSVVREGPRRLLGVGLSNPFNTQGVRRILAMMEHLWHRTPTGKLLLLNLEDLILELGVFGSLFDEENKNSLAWALTPSAWIKSVFQYAHDKQISLNILQLQPLRPSRQGDRSLMRSFSDHGLDIKDLLRLNRCRVFYRVTTLADISTARGTNIAASYLGSHGRDATGFSRYSDTQWAYQQRPPRSDLKFFRDCVQTIFCSDETWNLRKKLGPWTISAERLRHNWDWFYHNASKSLVLLHLDAHTTWYELSASQPKTRYSQHFQTSPYATKAKGDASFTNVIRVSISYSLHSAFIMENYSVPVRISPTPHIPQSLTDRFMYYLSLCPEGPYVTQYIDTSANIDGLVSDIIDNKGIAVSDGSYYKNHNHIGSASWILTGADDTEFIIGGGLCPGQQHEMNSYRTELWGLLGISVAVWALEKAAGITGSWIIGCDGMSALRQSLITSPETLTARAQHFDLISAIMGYWKNIKCTAVPTWVEAHQDDYADRASLPRLNRLNTERDDGAKRICQTNFTTYRPFEIKFKYAFPQISYKGEIIKSAAEKVILRRLVETPLRDYWMHKCEITRPYRQLISWRSFELATQRLPLYRQHFLINWLSHMTPVGSVTRIRKMGYQHRCPRCGEWNETFSHVVTCHNPQARRLRNTLLDGLRGWMHENDTCPEITSALLTIFTDWFRKPSSFRLPFLFTENQALHRVVADQHNIGWFNMLQGMQTTGWAKLQDAHFRTLPFCNKSGTTWASKLQFELWTFLWDMWSHRQDTKKQHPSAEDIVMQREIRDAACEELRIGMSTLPPLYRIYFAMNRDKLLSKSAADIRAWLRVVRGAREADNIFASDFFSENGPHRSWLGMPRRVQAGQAPSIPLRQPSDVAADFTRNNSSGVAL